MKEKDKKKWSVSIIIIGMLFLMLASALPIWAAGNHYQPGVEGVMGATAPPPGFHYRQYNIYLESDTLTDKNGDDLDIGFDLTVLAQTHRLIYITNHKFLGADYGMDLLVPVVGTDFNIDAFGVHDSEIGLGDICVEPLILAWHKNRYDVGLGLGINLPTGKFDQNAPASSGQGYMSGILTLGATYYLDQAKSWSVSAVSRTLVYGEQKSTDITPGWEFIVDWGIGKEFPISKGLLIRPGLCGYGYWQIGEDSGPDTNDDKGRNYAIGAEVNLFWLPPHLFQTNLRVLQDFGAENEAETTKVILTFTKSF